MALDTCHEQVVRALQKEGLRVDQKPLRIIVGSRQVYIDIRAMRGTNGSQQPILLVEVKCFPNRKSTTEDLYGAIGQYIVYRAMLMEIENAVPLYLAIPEDIFTAIIDSPIQRALRDTSIKLVIVNLETETVTTWME